MALMLITEAPLVLWGILDTKDNLWLGIANEGPKVFSNKLLADISARMADVQLGTYAGRHRAVQYFGHGAKYDEKRSIRTPNEAFELLEEGKVL